MEGSFTHFDQAMLPDTHPESGTETVALAGHDDDNRRGFDGLAGLDCDGVDCGDGTAGQLGHFGHGSHS